MTAYATFLCFSAVSKTPTSDCNPFVGESNVGVLLIGIGLTVLSLFWCVVVVVLCVGRCKVSIFAWGAADRRRFDGALALLGRGGILAMYIQMDLYSPRVFWCVLDGCSRADAFGRVAVSTRFQRKLLPVGSAGLGPNPNGRQYLCCCCCCFSH